MINNTQKLWLVKQPPKFVENFTINCQVTNRERWIIDRESELLPVPYCHILFTLPYHFNELLPANDKEVYLALFIACWQTIQTFAADPKYLEAKTAMVSNLHTWGQQLWLHPCLCRQADSRALHRTGGRDYSFWKMEKLQIRRNICSPKGH